MAARTNPIEEIKRRLDLLEVVGQYVALKKTGRNFKGLCPFHSEKTPSFYVFPEGQNWHCFGACGSGGDIFSFIMKAENLIFGEALRLLARRAGVELAPPTEAQREAQEARRHLAKINKAASEYFQAQLWAEGGHRAREYLALRGIQQSTIQEFQLGHASPGWEDLRRHLVARGYRPEDLHRVGLVIEREGGGYYDRFRDRLIFPIHHPEGEILGFGGRVLGEGTPKYLNSPQTPLFDKSTILYGLYHARGAIHEGGLAIIVEGYMDVLTAHQAGYHNVVASLGIALTETHLRTLRRYAGRLILALDADVAGSEATRRGLEVAKEALSDRVVPVPTPRGLIRYEHRLDAEMEVLTLPPGKDPDEIIRESPALWRKLLEEALPLVEWYFAGVAKECDLTTPQGKSKAARQLLPIVAEIGDEVQRAHYLQRLARMVQVDERTLWASRQPRGPSRRGIAGQRREDEVESPPQGSGPPESVADFCLGLLVREPALLIAAQEVELRPDDFARADDQELLRLLSQYVEARGSEACDGEGFRSFVKGEWLQRRLAELQGLSHLPIEREDAQKEFLRLRKVSQRRRLTELQFLMEEAFASRDAGEVARLQEAIRQAAEDYHRIDRMQDHRSLAGRRAEKATLRF